MYNKNELPLQMVRKHVNAIMPYSAPVLAVASLPPSAP